ncbi:VQ motif-containing protein 20 [Benincasa hispida]|uniref:VQ motif-containing protein 20 n=1 Tax=Benincasa hispida TaxID=102211 RepID=UPI00190061B7|nr:VQ motif-containing protein 20 [Benincasa hispida]
MSPQPQQQLHGKRDNQNQSINNGNGNGNKPLCPPPLKINKDSHLIRKSSSSSNTSSPSSSSSSTTSLVNGVKPPQRHPVIIYTHSPKIIHTHPRDFMALVQKLTGMSRSDDEASTKATTKSVDENNKGSKKAVVNDDNESSSVVTTDENCCGGGSGVVEGGQVNSCFGAAIFEPPPPPPPPQLANSYLTNIPVYRPNSTEFLCTNQPSFFNYDDSLLFGAHNIPSLSSNGINDFCEYSEF